MNQVWRHMSAGMSRLLTVPASSAKINPVRWRASDEHRAGVPKTVDSRMEGTEGADG